MHSSKFFSFCLSRALPPLAFIFYYLSLRSSLPLFVFVLSSFSFLSLFYGSLISIMADVYIVSINAQGLNVPEKKLLNINLNLFYKILASRLSPFYLTLSIKIKWPSNFIYHATFSSLPMCLLSTKAGKVNWDFMSETHRHIGLGPNMFNWISSLYSSPSALVKISGSFCSPFPITEGTGQYCPLYPMFFILTLGPVLCAIRANQDIWGISHGDLT